MRPKFWEDRVALYCAHLMECGVQSSTMSSYISAIKAILKVDKYEWEESRVLFSSLIRSCKLANDQIKARLPIHIRLLETILFEINRMFGDSQPFLQSLYKSIFCLGYYGLMRVGELATGTHTLLAKNIHIGTNKDKILIILYSSKTHNRANRPQKIKISGLKCDKIKHIRKRHFCPFSVTRAYLKLCGSYIEDQEQFFYLF